MLPKRPETYAPNIIANELDKDQCYVLCEENVNEYWIIWYEHDAWHHNKGTAGTSDGTFSVTTYAQPMFGLAHLASWSLVTNSSNLPSGVCGQCQSPIRFGLQDYLCGECRG